MRKCGPKKFVYYVEVCDWEACWPIGFFDTREKAETKLKLFKPDREIQESRVVKAEIF